MSEHIEHVCEILECLQHNFVYAKLKKCTFRVTSVVFLGFVLANSRIGMDKQQVISITNWPPPMNVKSLQSFLGFVSFYCSFIPNITKSVMSLFTLLKKDIKYEWSDERDAALNQLKSVYTLAPVLKHANINPLFIVETDVSDFAIGVIQTDI